MLRRPFEGRHLVLYSNAKSLVCNTENEHALERHAAAVWQLSNGTNGDDLYIRIATVGNTIQTVNSPMYDTHMSTPGNTAKLGTAHSNIQTAQSSPSLVGSEPTLHLSAHHWVSTLTHYASQACMYLSRFSVIFIDWKTIYYFNLI